jgi:hypothetical protein
MRFVILNISIEVRHAMIHVTHTKSFADPNKRLDDLFGLCEAL